MEVFNNKKMTASGKGASFLSLGVTEETVTESLFERFNERFVSVELLSIIWGESNIFQ